MARIKPRVKAPSTAKAGEIVTIKTLINHPMESGRRRDENGNRVPRRIINRFSVTFNGEAVFSVDLEPFVAANPYFQFEMMATETGALAFEWIDDDGSVYAVEKTIEVI